MNLKDVFLAAVFVLSLWILVALSGCTSTDNAEKNVKLQFAPIQCGSNSWEKWHSDLNRVYIRAPTEEEILKEYFSTVQGIQIISYHDIQAEPGTVTCMACNCARGDTIIVEVAAKDNAKMLELGWKETS